MPARSDLPSKPCVRCGRTMTWRARWARNWEEVRYCSDACRRGPRGVPEEALERAIIELLESRDAGGTICPSEAARYVRPEGWEGLMEAARQAARRLVHAGRLEITQKGRVVDPSAFRGPIRLRLPGR
jgi:hypothetical protein